MWALDNAGKVLAAASPWSIPQEPGSSTNWNVTAQLTPGASVAKCVIQGVDPAFSFGQPQLVSSTTLISALDQAAQTLIGAAPSQQQDDQFVADYQAQEQQASAATDPLSAAEAFLRQMDSAAVFGHAMQNAAGQIGSIIACGLAGCESTTTTTTTPGDPLGSTTTTYP